MSPEKFTHEVETLSSFIQIYCHDKHEGQYEKEYIINYKNILIKKHLNLCNECHEMFAYSISRLQECPHDPKPRCRTCPNPCYEKQKYKQMAKMMRYAGMKLGLTKAAKKIKKFFKSS